jgi:hypothetical protein
MQCSNSKTKGRKMKTRLLSLACYLGLAPQLWLVDARDNQDDLLRHHIYQSLTLGLLALFGFVFFLTVQVLEYVISFNFPDNDPNLYRIADVLSLLPCPTWWILLGIGITRAMRGSRSPLPLTTRLTAHKITRWGSVVWGFVFQIVCILAIVLPFRMGSTTRLHTGPSAAYLLYPDETFYPIPYTDFGKFTVPRWVFSLGFYPISEVATAQWGPDSVAVKPLTRANLNEALQYGRLVVVASHGTPAGIPLSHYPEEYFAPEDVVPGGVSSNLELVYLAGCNIGARGNAWEQALSPARVITFNRISWESEHVFWLWFVGPGLAAELR